MGICSSAPRGLVAVRPFSRSGTEKPSSRLLASQARPPRGASADASASVRLLSVNVWCHFFAAIAWILGFKRPKGTMPMVPFERRLDAVADAVETNAVDVVAAQELFLLRVGPFVFDGPYVRFRERMTSAGLVHATDPYASLPRFFGQNSGLAVFSAFPLQRERTEPFASSAETFNSKGSVQVDLDLGGGTNLRVVNTHLDAKNKRAQAAEVRELGSRLSGSIGPPGGPGGSTLVLAGDFNISPVPWGQDGPGPAWSRLCRELEASAGSTHRLDNAWGAVDDPDAFPPSLKGGKMVDHIWVYRPLRTPVSGSTVEASFPCVHVWAGLGADGGGGADGIARSLSAQTELAGSGSLRADEQPSGGRESNGEDDMTVRIRDAEGGAVGPGPDAGVGKAGKKAGKSKAASDHDPLLLALHVRNPIDATRR
mmetsp:Transcript_4773/g.13231  ORF Transcript_4773/g.13231 Transcript_4773/m.13231 type:complete len:426 (+) Transcript_4773:28-1305(+)